MPYGQSTVEAAHHHHLHLPPRITSKAALLLLLLLQARRDWQTSFHVKVLLPAFCSKSGKVICGIRKKIITLKEGSICEAKKRGRGESVPSKFTSPLSKTVITECCGVHFHQLSLTVYFPFTSLPSVWFTRHDNCTSTIVCLYLHVVICAVITNPKARGGKLIR